MAKLSKAARATAEELLRWDVARVAELARRGVEASEYQRRQVLAQAAAAGGAPPERWPLEVRDIFMALLEVHMDRQLLHHPAAARQPGQPVGQLMAHQHNVGPLWQGVPQRTAEELEALRELARELGVHRQLREVAPVQWGPA